MLRELRNYPPRQSRNLSPKVLCVPLPQDVPRILPLGAPAAAERGRVGARGEVERGRQKCRVVAAVQWRPATSRLSFGIIGSVISPIWGNISAKLQEGGRQRRLIDHATGCLKSS